MLSFAEITKRVAPRQLDLVNMHLSVMKAFQAAKKAMLKYSTHFKPSAQKGKRMWVHNDTLNKTGFHDVVTAGAFSAHSLRADRPGGLIK
ncbi:Uncharacterized protein OBRU01_15655 [Operophtera brumata]|uniref:Uncharacterized protein n=1 Tax=Operophtera brumata TaxID=104452 RepID=A0A0L7L4M7_OPEBR|nr:Uncharacterized protein OBRU01_15655 [Operophtera brumata]